MAKRILVPLDHSPIADSVVSLVADLARGSHATVRLLHVAPEPENMIDRDGRVIAYADQEMASLEAEALDYLQTVELSLWDLPVEAVVRFGNPVAEILRESEEFGADLIVVSTAGRSGLKRTVLGSVAETMLRRARTPVVLYAAAAPEAA